MSEPNLTDEKALPQSLEAERGVLGSLMLLSFDGNHELVARIRDGLTEDDFFHYENRIVFRAMAGLEACDIVIMRDVLKRGAGGQIGDPQAQADYLLRLVESVPSAANAEYYAKIVKDKSRLRRIIQQCSITRQAAMAGQDPPSTIVEPLVGLVKAMRGDSTGLECLESIPRRNLAWLWPNRIPANKISCLVGDPGGGKTFLSLYMAARVSTGQDWPDDSPCPAGSVIIANAEDDASDTLRPRLEAMGAALSKIHILEDMTLGGPCNRLERMVKSLGDCRLIIVDPISAFLSGVDSHKNAEIRAAFKPVKELCGATGTTFLMVSHLNKTAGVNAIYRITGSLAFGALSRAAWLVARDDNTPERRLLLPVKNNLSQGDPDGLAFKINPTGAVEFEPDPIVQSASQFFAEQQQASNKSSGRPPKERDEAEDWLRDKLVDGPMKAAELQAMAEHEGISWATVNRAKSAIGVRSMHAKHSPWYWSLPGTPDENLPARCSIEYQNITP